MARLAQKKKDRHAPTDIPMPKETSILEDDFTMDDLSNALKDLKTGKACGIDDICNEQISHFGVIARKWLLDLFNYCTNNLKIPKMWRKSRIIAILKHGKSPDEAKSYRPISLLPHFYKLYERLILNRLLPTSEQNIIPEQAGFRPGKSCTSQLLNLTEHIESGFENKQKTASVFVDLSAAFDTVNHNLLHKKLLKFTNGDAHLTNLISCLLNDRRFYVDLDGKKSRWHTQSNGVPQGSVLSPFLFNIYTNDQPIHPDTRSFIYADDLAIAAQGPTFEGLEATLSDALSELSIYYKRNCLKANPTKTQACAFHLNNREAGRKLRIIWEGTVLDHVENPVYLGVTLDRTLSFKRHIEKTKAKVNSRNSIIRKLANSKWGAHPSTLRTSSLALVFSVAEYACPVWGHSKHAKKLDPALNETCRIITGCLKPTNVNSLYLLAGIAPPDIRRLVATKKEKLYQETNHRHSLHNK